MIDRLTDPSDPMSVYAYMWFESWKCPRCGFLNRSVFDRCVRCGCELKEDQD